MTLQKIPSYIKNITKSLQISKNKKNELNNKMKNISEIINSEVIEKYWGMYNPSNYRDTGKLSPQNFIYTLIISSLYYPDGVSQINSFIIANVL